MIRCCGAFPRDETEIETMRSPSVTAPIRIEGARNANGTRGRAQPCRLGIPDPC